jgi:hypothetical protein
MKPFEIITPDEYRDKHPEFVEQLIKQLLDEEWADGVCLTCHGLQSVGHERVCMRASALEEWGQSVTHRPLRRAFHVGGCVDCCTECPYFEHGTRMDPCMCSHTAAPDQGHCATYKDEVPVDCPLLPKPVEGKKPATPAGIRVLMTKRMEQRDAY